MPTKKHAAPADDGQQRTLDDTAQGADNPPPPQGSTEPASTPEAAAQPAAGDASGVGSQPDAPGPDAPPPEAETPPAPAAVQVRALSDLPNHGARAGELASVPAVDLPGLLAQGLVDDHPDAVAAAQASAA